MENRVTEIITKVDRVIVPIVWENSNINFNSSLNCLKSVIKANPETCVVVNRTENADVPHVEKAISDHFPKIHRFVIKKFAAVPHSLDENLSIRDLANHKEHRQHRRFYNPVADQFDTIRNYLFA